MTGADGGVVTEMRGLSAWLAAQCPRARMALIERDPIGVGLYGDLRQFLPDEKRVLLNALKREGRRLGLDIESQYWTAAFGPLATPDMEPALREILTDPARDEQHQMLALFVLRIVEAGTPLSSLSELLLDIIHDDTRASSVKVLSLDAFLRTCPGRSGKKRLHSNGFWQTYKPDALPILTMNSSGPCLPGSTPKTCLRHRYGIICLSLVTLI